MSLTIVVPPTPPGVRHHRHAAARAPVYAPLPPRTLEKPGGAATAPLRALAPRGAPPPPAIRAPLLVEHLCNPECVSIAGGR